MTKRKRHLDTVKPFVNNDIPIVYNTDNINPIYVDNDTGEVWQKGKPKGAIVLPDVEVKGTMLKVKESLDKLPKEKGLENPMIDPFLLALGAGKYSGDIIGDLVGEGLGYAARPLTKYAAKKASDFGKYARGHVYYNVAPLGYDHPIQRGKAVLKGIASGKKADIENAPWIKDTDWEEMAKTYGVPAEDFKQARIDAWRMHNLLPQKYNTFAPSNTLIGAYQPNLKAIKDNPDIAKQLWKNIGANPKISPDAVGDWSGLDIVNGAGGNVGDVYVENFFGDPLNIRMPFSGVMRYQDVWDLHPFSRKGDEFTNKVIRPMTLGIANRLAGGVNRIGNRLYHYAMIDKQKTKAFREALKKGEQDALDVYVDTGENFVYKWDTPDLAKKIRNATIKTSEGILKGEEKLTSSAPFKAIDKKMKKFEVGNITGGKPFTVTTEIPFHRPSGLEMRDGKLYPARLRFGFDEESIATQAQQNWENTVSRGLYIKRNGGSINIKPSKKGTFTAAATKHGMGVQEFAARVLRNKEDYSPSLVKKANFARNASKWH